MRKSVRRRAMFKQVLCTLTVDEWNQILKFCEFKCKYCGRDGPLTVDHVKPLSKGGSHTKENVVPACLQCNVRKGSKYNDG